MGITTLVFAAAAALWLLFAFRYPQRASWFLLLWLPVQGWFQLNVFNDSSATVLLYEYQLVTLYGVFMLRALRSAPLFRPPPVLMYAAPFVVWTLLLVPRALAQNGPMLTLLGLRTELLLVPCVWVGYYAFQNRRQLETVATLLMLQMVIIAGVAMSQYAGLASLGGTVFEVPTGYVIAGVLRPPGTFSFAGHFGNYLIFIIPFALGLLGLYVPLWRRVCFAAGIVSGIVSLMVNTQRATIVLLAVMLPLMVMLAGRRQVAMKIAVGICIVLAGAVVGTRVAGESFQIRLVSILPDIRQVVIENPAARMTDALRTPLWGVGLGLASPGAIRLQPAPRAGTTLATRTSVKPSESYMASVVYETGLPGLLLLYLFFGAIMYQTMNAVRACRRTDMGLLAAALFAVQIAILLHSWPYGPLHYPPTRVLFWFWAGVLLALPGLAQPTVQQPIPLRGRGPTRVPQRRLVQSHRAPRAAPRVGVGG
jgi:hypothetical protein